MSEDSEEIGAERSVVEQMFKENVISVDSDAPENPWPVIMADPVSTRVLAMAESVASTPATVLLTGESGVGKEVFARFIHRNSRRANGPFVAINCAAIPEQLLESELFGHEKGAFSGAVKQHQGVFERANDGTLLLDELTEMPLELQAKLLRVIQEREVTRVGGTKSFKVDIRIIATTNRDLMKYVDEGNFRRDLYYRINVFPLAIPPLRERRGDIEPLFRFYLGKLSRIFNKQVEGITEAAVEKLRRYPFPGNVRELVNVAERAIIICGESPIIEADHILIESSDELVDRFRTAAQAEVARADSEASEISEADDEEAKLTFKVGAEALTDVRRVIILETLRQFDGNRTKTAESLGVSVRTIRNKLKQYRELGEDVPD
jgi:two-component system response regulator FlrC